jgi:Uma2 family endonuclease
MNTLEEIKHALERLCSGEREVIATWLQELADLEHREYTVEAPRTAHAVEESRPDYGASLPEYLTVDEYLKFEEKDPERHEYINGVLHAMAGASVAHNRIVEKLVLAFGNHLRGGPCDVFFVDLKLHLKIDEDEIFYYPDVVVACERAGWGPNYIHNPKLVVEVLSPSTQHIDRREKVQNYRRTVSIEEYVLVSQYEPKVTIHRRGENWRVHLFTGAEAIAEFRSIGLSLPLAQIYEGTP